MTQTVRIELQPDRSLIIVAGAIDSRASVDVKAEYQRYGDTYVGNAKFAGRPERVQVICEAYYK